MQIHISKDGEPIYAQIAAQVTQQVAAGRVRPGEELPAIRALALQLTVNPNTVARAYRDLERAGLVTARRTAGTYVTEGAAALALAECRKALAGRVDALLDEARRLNVGLDEVLDLVRRQYKSFTSAE